jgi:hypothetical protein
MGITVQFTLVWQEGQEPPAQRQAPWVDTGEMDKQVNALNMIADCTYVMRTRYLVHLIDAAFGEFRQMYVMVDGLISANALIAVIAQHTDLAIGQRGVFKRGRVRLMLRSATARLHYCNLLQHASANDFHRVNLRAIELRVFPEVYVFLPSGTLIPKLPFFHSGNTLPRAVSQPLSEQATEKYISGDMPHNLNNAESGDDSV